MIGRRVWVGGAPGVGKTTLAGQLAARHGLVHHELDALVWLPGWTKRDPAEFRARVDDLVAGESWVIDGCYPEAIELLCARVDTFIWVDVPLPVALLRVTRRTIRRILRREVLWNGNVESVRNVLGSESILVYAARSHRRKIRELAHLSSGLRARGVHCLHVANAHELP